MVDEVLDTLFHYLLLLFILDKVLDKIEEIIGTEKVDNTKILIETDWFYEVNSNFFWHCRVSFVNFNYWSKFHVNIMTGSEVMTVFIYKRFTRIPEIRNTPFWVLPNIWRMGQIMDTKFGTNVPNKM